jgi:predicted phosphodiesterase
MIFVTGDTHGKQESISRFNTANFPEQKEMTIDDVVIVAGDFGFIWDGSKFDQFALDWFSQKNYMTLFIDGNHENFTLLEKYPIEMWNGGKVHRINDRVLHLMRGQVFEIQGNKIFTFGGAESRDKGFRKPFVSWWPQEIPSNAEFEEGLSNLDKYNWDVDYVITHTVSESAILQMREQFHMELDEYYTDPTTKYLETIQNKLKFKHWYFGHYHVDIDINSNMSAMFEDVVEIL